MYPTKLLMDNDEKEITLTSEIILNDAFYDDGDKQNDQMNGYSTFRETTTTTKATNETRTLNSMRVRIRKPQQQPQQQQKQQPMRRPPQELDFGDVVTIDYFTVEEKNKPRSITSQMYPSSASTITTTTNGGLLSKNDEDKKVKVDTFYADKPTRKTNAEREKKILNNLYNKLESRRRQEEKLKPKEYKISISIRISDELKNEEKTFKINRIENVVENIKDIAKAILNYSIQDKMLMHGSSSSASTTTTTNTAMNKEMMNKRDSIIYKPLTNIKQDSLAKSKIVLKAPKNLDNGHNLKEEKIAIKLEKEAEFKHASYIHTDPLRTNKQNEIIVDRVGQLDRQSQVENDVKPVETQSTQKKTNGVKEESTTTTTINGHGHHRGSSTVDEQEEFLSSSSENDEDDETLVESFSQIVEMPAVVVVGLQPDEMGEKVETKVKKKSAVSADKVTLDSQFYDDDDVFDESVGGGKSSELVQPVEEIRSISESRPEQEANDHVQQLEESIDKSLDFEPEVSVVIGDENDGNDEEKKMIENLNQMSEDKESIESRMDQRSEQLENETKSDEVEDLKLALENREVLTLVEPVENQIQISVPNERKSESQSTDDEKKVDIIETEAKVKEEPESRNEKAEEKKAELLAELNEALQEESLYKKLDEESPLVFEPEISVVIDEAKKLDTIIELTESNNPNELAVDAGDSVISQVKLEENQNQNQIGELELVQKEEPCLVDDSLAFEPELSFVDDTSLVDVDDENEEATNKTSLSTSLNQEVAEEALDKKLPILVEDALSKELVLEIETATKVLCNEIEQDQVKIEKVERNPVLKQDVNNHLEIETFETQTKIGVTTESILEDALSKQSIFLEELEKETHLDFQQDLEDDRTIEEDLRQNFFSSSSPKLAAEPPSQNEEHEEQPKKEDFSSSSFVAAHEDALGKQLVLANVESVAAAAADDDDDECKQTNSIEDSLSKESLRLLVLEDSLSSETNQRRREDGQDESLNSSKTMIEPSSPIVDNEEESKPLIENEESTSPQKCEDSLLTITMPLELEVENSLDQHYYYEDSLDKFILAQPSATMLKNELPDKLILDQSIPSMNPSEFFEADSIENIESEEEKTIERQQSPKIETLKESSVKHVEQFSQNLLLTLIEDSLTKESIEQSSIHLEKSADNAAENEFLCEGKQPTCVSSEKEALKDMSAHEMRIPIENKPPLSEDSLTKESKQSEKVKFSQSSIEADQESIDSDNKKEEDEESETLFASSPKRKPFALDAEFSSMEVNQVQAVERLEEESLTKHVASPHVDSEDSNKSNSSFRVDIKVKEDFDVEKTVLTVEDALSKQAEVVLNELAYVNDDDCSLGSTEQERSDYVTSSENEQPQQNNRKESPDQLEEFLVARICEESLQKYFIDDEHQTDRLQNDIKPKPNENVVESELIEAKKDALKLENQTASEIKRNDSVREDENTKTEEAEATNVEIVPVEKPKDLENDEEASRKNESLCLAGEPQRLADVLVEDSLAKEIFVQEQCSQIESDKTGRQGHESEEIEHCLDKKFVVASEELIRQIEVPCHNEAETEVKNGPQINGLVEKLADDFVENCLSKEQSSSIDRNVELIKEAKSESSVEEDSLHKSFEVEPEVCVVLERLVEKSVEVVEEALGKNVPILVEDSSSKEVVLVITAHLNVEQNYLEDEIVSESSLSLKNDNKISLENSKDLKNEDSIQKYLIEDRIQTLIPVNQSETSRDEAVIDDSMLSSNTSIEATSNAETEDSLSKQSVFFSTSLKEDSLGKESPSVFENLPVDVVAREYSLDKSIRLDQSDSLFKDRFEDSLSKSFNDVQPKTSPTEEDEPARRQQITFEDSLSKSFYS